jgi:saccharopine dehydrogenase-like NADP-dependent oxidoreductase
MKDIALIGAGHIGETITSLLTDGGYRLTVADRDPGQLARIAKGPRTATIELDVLDEAALVRMLEGKFAVISAMPHGVTRRVAAAARKANVHYLDLTEDVATTRLVKELAADSDKAFIPQCGLAPGFVSIAAADLASRFDTLDSLHLRVGALPQFPSNALNYNLTWSTDGLINEYDQPCEAIVEGRLCEVPPLDALEGFSLDGIRYEAFSTSGGLGTLAETLAGKVRELNYKTVRYPGHRDIAKILVQDLRLGERRELLKDIFEYALPTTMQDVVLVFVTASGHIGGRFVQQSYANKIYSAPVASIERTAIQITTAGGICAVLDLLAQNRLPQKGLVRQEEIPLATFLANRFGKAYAGGIDLTPLERAA